MRARVSRLALLCALVLPAPLAAQARVLFIGNSYTYVNDLPNVLARMAATAGRPLHVESVAVGGATLEQHWRSGAALRRIRGGDWDYVVLQEQSQRPITDPARYLDYAARFAREIRAVGAAPVLYGTWARRSAPASQDSLDRVFQRASAVTSAALAPAGAAWRAYLALDPAAPLHDADGSHPAPLGTYLAALAIYRALFDDLPAAAPGALRISERDAQRARDVVSAVLQPARR